MANAKQRLTKRIPLSQLQIGMISAEDIVNSSGLLIIKKHTQISTKHIFRMTLYQIINVLVYLDNTSEEEEQTPSVDEPFSPAFNEFMEVYDKTNVYAKDCLNNIVSGSSINSDDLFQVSNNLLNSLDSVSDLFSFLQRVRSKDGHIFSHSMNVSMLCNVFGRWLKLSTSELKDLTIAGLIHDIGKLEIDENIINKPGQLTKDEFNIIKQHPVKGFEMIKDKDFTYEVKMSVLQHHEKFDGSGYPFGFKNAQLCTFSKIVAITDIYEAMTSERSYRKKNSPFKVIEIFEKESYNMLDTNYLFIFLENIAQNYVGSSVLLSNQETGRIVFINKKNPSRPLVEVGSKIYNLESEPTIYVQEIIS